jgi:CDGSH-type Zn-finger protein
MGKCTCGKTLTEPWCDGSHTLTEAQYQEKIRILAEEEESIYGKPTSELFKGPDNKKETK